MRSKEERDRVKTVKSSAIAKDKNSLLHFDTNFSIFWFANQIKSNQIVFIHRVMKTVQAQIKERNKLKKE